MKILFVDQFGKTTGRDTLALAELMNVNKDIIMEVYLSDSTEIPKDRVYTVGITKGFYGAYEGNFLNKGKNYLKALRELKLYIDKNRFDIIHLQWFSIPWIEWIYVARLKKQNKIVITVHDVIPFDKRPMEIKFLNKIYARANALIVHTKTSKKLFENIYSVKVPIKVVTQGFCNKADYQRINNTEAKMHFGIPKEAVVFLYYGTVRESKGLKVLIEAINKAYKISKKVYFLAAGAFHRVDEKEYKELVATKLEKKASNVKFKYVPQEEEQWYFSAADVLCLPYLEVTQSGVAQLGLMYELPMIATNVGEMTKVCRDGENGIICRPNNQKDIMEAILKFSENQELRKKASEKSKLLGQTEFSLKVKAERIVEVYKKLKG